MKNPGTAVVLALFSLPLPSACVAETYTLGPGDHVQVWVSDFRSGTGEAYQWRVYQTGLADFVVGPDGRLSLPVLGALDASGKTTADLEEAIATKLQAKAGLTVRPDASVQIVKYRPFYIIGAVDKPGEYEYKPGLTVLQALAVAGGLQRATSDQLLGLEREALVSRGDLRLLSADRISLLARQARLEAEIEDKSELTFTGELLARSGEPDAARVLKEEQLLFDADRRSLADQVNALEQSKAYLRNELVELQQKAVTNDKALAAMRKELDLVAGLVVKGLTAAPRQLELQQNIAQLENNQIDAQVAITRANEDIARSDREILDLKTKFRRDLLQQAAEVRDRLAETNEKTQTSQALIQEAEVRAPALILPKAGDAYQKLTYAVSRRDKDGKAENLAVDESDLIQPGDVVRVIPAAPDISALRGLHVADGDALRLRGARDRYERQEASARKKISSASNSRGTLSFPALSATMSDGSKVTTSAASAGLTYTANGTGGVALNALTITSPASGATETGAFTVSGTAGSNWNDIAAFDSNWNKLDSVDVTPSNGTFTLNVNQPPIPHQGK